MLDSLVAMFPHSSGATRPRRAWALLLPEGSNAASLARSSDRVADDVHPLGESLIVIEMAGTDAPTAASHRGVRPCGSAFSRSYRAVAVRPRTTMTSVSATSPAPVSSSHVTAEPLAVHGRQGRIHEWSGLDPVAAAVTPNEWTGGRLLSRNR